MEKLLLLFILVCQLKTSGAQDTTALTYSEVVKVDSVSSEELFRRARSWFNASFKDSKSVLNIADPESGELAGNGSIEYKSSIYRGSDVTRGWISFRISVFVKDGRYKYELSNYTHEGSPSSISKPENFGLITQDSIYPYSDKKIAQKWANSVWVDIKVTADNNSQALIASLKSAMMKPSGTADNKW